jgi:hypothetical protein
MPIKKQPHRALTNDWQQRGNSPTYSVLGFILLYG